MAKDVVDKDLVEDEEYVIGSSETDRRVSGDDMEVTSQVSKSQSFLSCNRCVYAVSWLDFAVLPRLPLFQPCLTMIFLRTKKTFQYNAAACFCNLSLRRASDVIHCTP